MPMKEKSKEKCSIEKYQCEACNMIFENKPRVLTADGPKPITLNFCSNLCVTVFLKNQKSNMIYETECFIDEKLTHFIETIAQRVDYEFILNSIRERIRARRFKMVESYYGQQQENEK